MKNKFLKTDFCVVGGGLAGMIAALSAARRGVKTVLIQDRPVLGGNSSSEIRMHVCGAHGSNMRETGIIEELMLDNYRYNHTPNYTMWDAVLYGKVKTQENLIVLLNASVNSLEMRECGLSSPQEKQIKSVTAWQTTSETWITVEAALFADCSGDGILAPLSGADFRMGREGRDEFNESIAPEVADKKTMGMSCLFQAREHATPQPFTPFPWAYHYDGPEVPWLNGRNCNIMGTNFWWMEIGGEVDSIHDAEKCRDELMKIAFGVWDYLKNHDKDKERYANFSLDWQAFLPGKRESRRYYGDVVLNQNDVRAAGKHFDDIVAYGGWSMDDHFPAGFYHIGHGTIYHPAPSPYGIPYRSLYSRNIGNLFCAGRCHSATHSAMSSTRVMGTTSLMGQAVGAAAAIAIRDNLSPRGVYEQRRRELQQSLMDDDCHIPWHSRDIAQITKNAKLSVTGTSVHASLVENLRNGVDRPVGDEDNGFHAVPGAAVEYDFGKEEAVSEIRLVFDSDLNRTDPSRPIGQKRLLNMRYYIGKDDKPFTPPATLVKDFRIETRNASGAWETAAEITGNFQRLVKIPLAAKTSAVRLVPLATWGADTAHVFAFEAR